MSRTQKIIIAALLSAAAITIYWNIFSLNITSQKESLGTDTLSEALLPDGFSDNNILSQSFFIHERCRLNSINIQMTIPADPVNSPSITVSLTDKFGSVIFEQNIAAADINSNGFTQIDTNGILLSGTDRYFVVLKGAVPNGTANTCPSIYTTSPDSCNDILYCMDSSINGKVMNSYYEYETVPLGITEIITMLIIILVIFTAVFISGKHLRYVPFVLAAPLGLSVIYGALRCDYHVNQALFDVNLSKRCFIICILTITAASFFAFILQKKKLSCIRKLGTICNNRIFARRSFRLALAGILILCLFIFQIAAASRLYQKIGWDVNDVVKMARNLYQDGSLGSKAHYLGLFPNNKGLLLIFYSVLRLFNPGSVREIYWLLVDLNIIFIDLALILAYLTAKQLFGTISAIITTAFLLILLGFSGWIIVPYTDTYSVWMPVLICYLYTKQKKCCCPSCKTRIFLWGIIGFLSVLGYHIKPQCIIVTIAICIIELITAVNNRRHHGVLSLACIAGALVGAGLFTLTAQAVLGDDNHSDIAVPAVHFLMMGASENPYSVGIGGYNSDDTAGFTYKYETTAEKKEACLERLRSKLASFSISGYYKHLCDKAEWILGDGSFSWGMEGSFFLKDYSADKTDSLQFFIRERLMGSKKMQHFGIINGIWLTVLLLFIIPFGKASSASAKMVIYLAAIGCILFTLLFEGRSRYLINYIPFFCIIAGGSAKRLLSRFSVSMPHD